MLPGKGRTHEDDAGSAGHPRRRCEARRHRLPQAAADRRGGGRSPTRGCARQSATHSTGLPSLRRSVTWPPTTTCHQACPPAPAAGLPPQRQVSRPPAPISGGPARWQARAPNARPWPSAAAGPPGLLNVDTWRVIPVGDLGVYGPAGAVGACRGAGCGRVDRPLSARGRDPVGPGLRRATVTPCG